MRRHAKSCSGYSANLPPSRCITPDRRSPWKPGTRVRFSTRRQQGRSSECNSLRPRAFCGRSPALPLPTRFHQHEPCFFLQARRTGPSRDRGSPSRHRACSGQPGGRACRERQGAVGGETASAQKGWQRVNGKKRSSRFPSPRTESWCSRPVPRTRKRSSPSRAWIKTSPSSSCPERASRSSLALSEFSRLPARAFLATLPVRRRLESSGTPLQSRTREVVSGGPLAHQVEQRTFNR